MRDDFVATIDSHTYWHSDSDSSQIAWLKLFLPTHESTIVGLCYLSPSISPVSRRVIFDSVEQVLRDNAHTDTKIFLGGDFNAHHTDWQPDRINNNSTGVALANLIDTNHLHCVNTDKVNSRHVATMKKTGNVVDLCFANTHALNIVDQCAVLNDIVLNGLPDSDHFPLSVSLTPVDDPIIHSSNARTAWRIPDGDLDKDKWDFFRTTARTSLLDWRTKLVLPITSQAGMDSMCDSFNLCLTGAAH